MKLISTIIVITFLSAKAYSQIAPENDFAKKIFESKAFQVQKLKIEKLSEGERTLKLIQVSEPSGEAPYYYFKAAEDNGTNYVTHIHFRAYLESGRIVIYDPLEDVKIESK